MADSDPHLPVRRRRATPAYAANARAFPPPSLQRRPFLPTQSVPKSTSPQEPATSASPRPLEKSTSPSQASTIPTSSPQAPVEPTSPEPAKAKSPSYIPPSADPPSQVQSKLPQNAVSSPPAAATLSPPTSSPSLPKAPRPSADAALPPVLRAPADDKGHLPAPTEPIDIFTLTPLAALKLLITATESLVEQQVEREQRQREDDIAAMAWLAPDHLDTSTDNTLADSTNGLPIQRSEANAPNATRLGSRPPTPPASTEPSPARRENAAAAAERQSGDKDIDAASDDDASAASPSSHHHRDVPTAHKTPIGSPEAHLSSPIDGAAHSDDAEDISQYADLVDDDEDGDGQSASAASIASRSDGTRDSVASSRDGRGTDGSDAGQPISEALHRAHRRRTVSIDSQISATAKPDKKLEVHDSFRPQHPRRPSRHATYAQQQSLRDGGSERDTEDDNRSSKAGTAATSMHFQRMMLARKFNSKAVPPIPLSEYLHRLHTYCPMSTAAYLAAGWYIQRLTAPFVEVSEPESPSKPCAAAKGTDSKAADSQGTASGLTDLHLSRDAPYCHNHHHDPGVHDILDPEMRTAAAFHAAHAESARKASCSASSSSASCSRPSSPQPQSETTVYDGEKHRNPASGALSKSAVCDERHSSTLMNHDPSEPSIRANKAKRHFHSNRDSRPSGVDHTAVAPLVTLSPRTAHRLVLAALRVATKALEDRPYPHARIAKVGGVGERELARLEISLCFLVGFDLLVGPEALAWTAAWMRDRPLHSLSSDE